jgi:hypothetical protein
MTLAYRAAMRSVVVALVVLSGCAIDADEDLELSETTQAITWTTVTYRDCTRSPCNTPLVVGDADTQTCFLAGVTGHILDGSVVAVSINNTTNKWELRGQGHFVKIGATCVSTVANRIFGQSHNVSSSVGPATALRRCFLRAFYFHPHPISQPGNPNYGDQARVFVGRGNYWYVQSSMVNHTTDSSAFAVCIDVPVNNATYTFHHDTSGTGTATIGVVPNSGACGLQGINGRFDHTGPATGVRITNTYPMTWHVTFEEHAGATVSCVQPF